MNCHVWGEHASVCDATNMLFEGDNLHAMRALLPAMEGAFRLIYLDPPYNTGQNLKFFHDSLDHGAWVEFMRIRLQLLKSLLHQEGMMAVQIDDREFPRLWMLMEEEFGEKSLKVIVVKMSEASGVKIGAAKHLGIIPKMKEYIILAKRNGVRALQVPRIHKEKWDNEYHLFLDNYTRADRKIIHEIRSKEEILENDLEIIDKICEKIIIRPVRSMLHGYPEDLKEEWKYKNAWRIVRTASSNSVLQLAEAKKIYAKAQIFSVRSPRDQVLYLVKCDYKKNSRRPRVQILFAEDHFYVHLGDLWTDIKTTGLDSEGGVTFQYGKKPEELLKRIIEMNTQPGDYVLDPFAGSGTTGAVAQKLGRKWVMMEKGDQCREQIVPRLTRVRSGEDRTGVSKSIQWEGGGEDFCLIRIL